MSALAKRGFSATQMQIYSGDADSPLAPDPLAKSNVVLKDMLVDGAIGTAVGTGPAASHASGRDGDGSGCAIGAMSIAASPVGVRPPCQATCAARR